MTTTRGNVGRKSPVEPYPLLYLSKRTKRLVQVKRIGRKYSIKPGQIVTREYIEKNYEFYGVIDRHGTVISYVKEGRVWKKHRRDIIAIDGVFKTARESEKRIVEELNALNRRNPELAFYPLDKATDSGEIRTERKTLAERVRMEAQENFEEV